MRGLTVVEILAVFVIFAILISSGLVNLKALVHKNRTAAEEVSAFLNLVRGMAISQTRTIVVKPITASKLVAVGVGGCSETTGTSLISLDLPNGSTFTQSDWSICFNSKGLSNASGSITINEGDKSSSVQISLGGISRVAE